MKEIGLEWGGGGGVRVPNALSWIRQCVFLSLPLSLSDFSSDRLFVYLCSYLSLDTATVTVAHKLNPSIELDIQMRSHTTASRSDNVKNRVGRLTFKPTVLSEERQLLSPI